MTIAYSGSESSLQAACTLKAFPRAGQSRLDRLEIPPPHSVASFKTVTLLKSADYHFGDRLRNLTFMIDITITTDGIAH